MAFNAGFIQVKNEIYLGNKIMSFRQFLSFFCITILTLMLAITIAFDFGTTSALAATLPTQLVIQSQPQLATLNRVEAIAKSLEGESQAAAANITGDPKDQIMGRVKQTASQIRNAGEDIKNQIQPEKGAKEIARNLENQAQEAIDNVTSHNKYQKIGKMKHSGSLKENTGWLTF